MTKTIANPLIQNIHEFFDWWFAELQSLLPSVISRNLQRLSKHYLIQINSDRISAIHLTTNVETTLLKKHLPSSKNIEQANNLVKQLKIHANTPAIINAENVLRTRLDLPRSAQGSHLGGIVQNQIQKITPFRAEEVFYDYKQVFTKETDGNITIEIAILHQKFEHSYREQCSRIGILPDSLYFSDTEKLKDHDFTFKTNSSPKQSSKALSIVKKILSVLLVMLISIMLVQPLISQKNTIAEHQQTVESYRKKIKVKATIASKIAALSTPHNFAIDTKKNRPPNFILLAELSKIIPPHSWVFQFQRNASAINIQGISSNTSEIIKHIENSKYFQNVALESGIIRKAGSSKERFHLKFDIASEVSHD
ncbi:MAG: PilN domain-containing protein [Sneathiella sp.]